MKNAALLHLLAACNQLGEPPVGRTAIVKMSYLCELLRPTYDLWQQSYKFVRYNYGPYSTEVFDSLSYLTFHGLTKVVTYAPTESGVHAQYICTDDGLRASQILRERGGQTAYNLAEDVVWSLQGLGVRTAKQMCVIVYAEPYFAKVLERAEATGTPPAAATPLMSGTDPAHPVFRIQAILRTHKKRLTPRQMVHSTLEYLSLKARGMTSS